MKPFNLYLLAAMLVPLCLCCGKGSGQDGPLPGTEPTITELALSDPHATAETKALYSNLWAIRGSGWMFGHHDDLMYGRKWYGEEGRSDTKEVCGDYPGVFSVDVATLMDDRKGKLADEDALRVKCIKDAYDRGMVTMICMHLNNPLTGSDSWDNSSKEVVAQILSEGSATRVKFDLWLDNLADLALSLKGSDGKLIPVICRPFHEHTQGWSWWGSSCCTQEEFIALWRHLVDYMRYKGVHNFIYAIAPQMDSKKVESDFLFRWPGDDYVDFIGMDCYQGINNNVFLGNLKLLGNLSTRMKKPCGVTETGVEGFTAEDYWITNIAAPMAGRKMSLLVTWRNKFDPTEAGTHFFSVFPGHPSVESFIQMYNRSDTFFCENLPDMYEMAENISVK